MLLPESPFQHFQLCRFTDSNDSRPALGALYKIGAALGGTVRKESLQKEFEIERSQDGTERRLEMYMDINQTREQEIASGIDLGPVTHSGGVHDGNDVMVSDLVDVFAFEDLVAGDIDEACADVFTRWAEGSGHLYLSTPRE